MNDDFKNTAEYLDKQAEIIKKQKLLLPIDEKIVAANKVLQSFSFKMITAIGLGPEDFRSDTFDIDTVLPGLANTNLSEKDLNRKVELLLAQKLQILEEINGLEAELRQLELNARLSQEQQRTANRLANAEAFINAFNKDRLTFLAAALSVAPVEASKEKLFASADQIIAISSKFDDKIDKQHLWKAWQVVAKARDVAAKNLFDVETYARGAEQTFNSILNILPKDVQDLKVLYNAKLYQRVDDYLELILFKDLVLDQDKMQHLREQIDEQKHIISKQELERIAGKTHQKFKGTTNRGSV